MVTLATAIDTSSASTAIIVPHDHQPLTITYQTLAKDVTKLQQKLASLGLTAKSAVSIALPNSYEFVVAFLAVTWQRAIAAPLNPAYKQREFEFYIQDIGSSLLIAPRGSYDENYPAISAARKYGVAIAECSWDDGEVRLDVKSFGEIGARPQVEESILRAEPDDVALVLHTSGTTGKPKAVSVDRVEMQCPCRYADMSARYP